MINNIDNFNQQQQQQQDNEIIFWNVFHNKYLRYLIFEKIENALVIGERKKFKHINSLDWLIKHKQYPLLKCKLEAGEHIEYCKDSLRSLLYDIIDNIKIDSEKDGYNEEKEYTEYILGDEYIDHEKINENKVNKSKLKQINLKQSFYLLLKYKSSELFHYNLIQLMTDNCCQIVDSIMVLEELIDHLLSTEPYCSSTTLINSKTIKSVIKSCPPSILSKLLNHLERMNKFNTIITDDIKNTSISLIAKEERGEPTNIYKESMLEFILNNDQLYNIPSPSNKVIKIGMGFLSIKSSVIQNKLLHLNYVEFPTNGTDEFKLKLKELLNNNNYIGGVGDIKEYNGEFVRIKELFKLITNEVLDGALYKLYLSKYDEVIMGLKNNSVVYEYSLESKSVNGLKYLLSPHANVKKPLANYKTLINSSSLLKPFSISNESDTNEFIKLYTTGYRIVSHYKVDKQLLDYVFSIQSNEEYEQLLKSIIRTDENEVFTDQIPLKWYHIPLDIINDIKNSKRVTIKDTGSIDLILNGFNYFKYLYNHFNFLNNNWSMELQYIDSLFKYETYQLIDYVNSNFGGNNSIYFKYFNNEFPNETDNTILKELYMYPFTRAINNCDIDSLKHIDNLLSSKGIKFDKFQGCKSIDEFKYSKSVLKKMKQIKKSIKEHPDKIKINFNYQLLNNNKINELINYFNSSGFKLFSNELFKKFIKDISRLESMEPSISLSSLLNIDFKLFPVETVFELILNSISNYITPNIIQLILNNFNPFTIHSSIINPIIYKWEKEYNQLYDTSYYLKYTGGDKLENHRLSCLEYYDGYDYFICYSYESSINIISTIKLLLHQNIIQINYNSDIIQILINHLFKRYIKVYKVSIEEIQSTYEFIKSEWLSITGIEFKFQHSLYHVIFYLASKSYKLVYDLFEIHRDFLQVEPVVDNTLGFEYSNSKIYFNLNPDIFTYHYIFNTPIDQISKKINDEHKNGSYED